MSDLKKIAFVGIGNPFAGDDGAGIEAIKRLEKRLTLEQKKDFLFYTITEDLFVISEYISLAKYFIFLDAYYGKKAGEIITFTGDYKIEQRHSLSFHQTDIITVMNILKKLRLCEPFPDWEVWGVTISPPSFLTTTLSKEVDGAVDKLIKLIIERIHKEMFTK